MRPCGSRYTIQQHVMAFVCMSEKVIRPPPPNLCVVFLQRIPCIKIVCLVHKRLRVTRGVYVFIYRLLVGGVSWSFYSRDCSYLGGSFTVSGATWTRLWGRLTYFWPFMATREEHISSFKLYVERNHPQMSQQPSWPSNLFVWPNLKAVFLACWPQWAGASCT